MRLQWSATIPVVGPNLQLKLHRQGIVFNPLGVEQLLMRQPKDAWSHFLVFSRVKTSWKDLESLFFGQELVMGCFKSNHSIVTQQQLTKSVFFRVGACPGLLQPWCPLWCHDATYLVDIPGNWPPIPTPLECPEFLSSLRQDQMPNHRCRWWDGTRHRYCPTAHIHHHWWQSSWWRFLGLGSGQLQWSNDFFNAKISPWMNRATISEGDAVVIFMNNGQWAMLLFSSQAYFAWPWTIHGSVESFWKGVSLRSNLHWDCTQRQKSHHPLWRARKMHSLVVAPQVTSRNVALLATFHFCRSKRHRPFCFNVFSSQERPSILQTCCAKLQKPRTEWRASSSGLNQGTYSPFATISLQFMTCLS